MNKEKYLELFKKFYKNNINIDGVILIPKTIDDNLILVFEIENDHNLPFTKTTLSNLMIENIQSFNNLLSIDEVLNPGIMGEKIYVSEQLREQTHNILINKNKIILPERIGRGKEGNSELAIIVEHVKFEYEVLKADSKYYSDELILKNFVKPISAYYTDSGQPINLENAVGEYENSYRRNRYLDSDNYNEIDELISCYNTFINYDFMTNFIKTEFI